MREAARALCKPLHLRNIDPPSYEKRRAETRSQENSALWTRDDAIPSID